MAGLDYLPSWGQLPVEHYLIVSFPLPAIESDPGIHITQKSWTPASTEQTPMQRTRLVKQFLNLGQPNPNWDPTGGALNPDAQPARIPTEEEISTILRPWRSNAMRRRAWWVWQSYNKAGSNPVLLRTWYDPADNERVKSWATLEYWQRVYETLPEIVVPHPSQCSRSPVSEFKRGVNAIKRANPSWRADLNILVRDNAAALELLHAVSKSYILIADKETFKTDHFLLASLDANGRVTLQGRVLVDGDRLSEISLEWSERRSPHKVFGEGTLGEEFMVVAGNEVDREMYG
ncbi:hypothetical protein BDW74DRAFT_182853 [Aspergillus multicolor]|uniref:uncharacterized protein n=1 Tax=Aspergillus multicolor TaxID=41759 RepID=UPI003CCE38B1